MKKLENQELMEITGGTISGTLINAVSTILKTISSLGRNFGSAIRRVASDQLCPL